MRGGALIPLFWRALLAFLTVPLFAVPCPTALVTAGFLIATAGAPRVAALLPVLWAAVGSSAALALGIRADLALVVAGVALALEIVRPAALGPRGAVS